MTGTLTKDSVLDRFRLSLPNVAGIHENQLVANPDINENDVKLVEKIDDIAEGAINSCNFYGKRILATGSGSVLYTLSFSLLIITIFEFQG